MNQPNSKEEKFVEHFDLEEIEADERKYVMKHAEELEEERHMREEEAGMHW